VTLLAFAAERAAAMHSAAGRPAAAAVAVDISCPPGPQQQTRHTLLQRPI